MWPVMDQKLARYRELEEQLSDPAVAGDHARFSTVAKEHGALARLVKPYLEYLHLEDSIKGAEAMLADGDPDMAALAQEE